MKSSFPHESAAVRLSRSSPDVRLLFTVEFLTSAGTNFLQVGIFFYTIHRFHWTLRDNFLLGAAQGVAYVLGAMNADRLTRIWSRRPALTRLYFCMMTVAFIGAMFPFSAVIAVLLPIYAGIGAMSWPILESLISEGLDSDALGRRIGIYNLMWSGSGALVLALNGTIIEHFIGGVFAFPAIFHGLSMMLVRISSRTASDPLPSVTSNTAHVSPVHVEPELLRLRTTALWLSRVALPATYVLIYGLMALMPSLPVLKPLDTARQTLVGSTWMATRLLTFIVLGVGTWWHTRPRLLIAAAWLMLFAFLGTVVRPSDLLGHGNETTDLVSMLASEVLLGIAIGLIYAASLYFGMVLSQGSTEHGGYHEALIGLGSVLGPGSGAIAQSMFPGNVRAGIIAVGSVVAASVLAVGATAFTIRIRGQKPEEEQ
jgi:MFS family permease